VISESYRVPERTATILCGVAVLAWYGTAYGSLVSPHNDSARSGA